MKNLIILSIILTLPNLSWSESCESKVSGKDSVTIIEKILTDADQPSSNIKFEVVKEDEESKVVKATYKDANGIEKSRHFTITPNQSQNKVSRISLLPDQGTPTARDAFIDLSLGFKTNEPYKIVTAIRMELEQAATLAKSPEELLALMEINKVIKENSDLEGENSKQAFVILQTWSKLKASRYQNVQLSESLIQTSYDRQLLIKDLNKTFTEPGNFRVVIPLVGEAHIIAPVNGETKSIILKAFVPNTLSRELMQAILKSFGIEDLATFQISSSAMAGHNQITIEFSKISMADSSAITLILKAVTDFLTDNFFATPAEMTQVKYSAEEVLYYLIKRERKVGNRFKTLDSKIEFIKAALNDFYKRKLKDFPNFKQGATETEALRLVPQVFRNLSAASTEEIQRREKKMFDDFLNNTKF